MFFLHPVSFCTIALPYISLYVSFNVLLKFNISLPSRFTLNVISNIANGSDVHSNLASWQNLSLQFIFDPIHMTLVLEMFGFRPEYLKVDWEDPVHSLASFKEYNSIINVCSKHTVSRPIFLYLHISILSNMMPHCLYTKIKKHGEIRPLCLCRLFIGNAIF